MRAEHAQPSTTVKLHRCRRMSRKGTETEQALGESEARYRAVVEHSPNGVVVSVDGRIVYVNPAAVSLSGAPSAADLVGRSIFEFFPEPYRAEVARRRTRMLETGLPAPLMEGRLRRLDGRLIAAEWTGLRPPRELRIG